MPITDEELQILIEKIALDHSWDLQWYKMNTLKRRIKMRMNLKKCKTVEEYYDLISESDEEYRDLINALTVNYTFWFRDELVWNEVLKVIHDKAKAGNKHIRIWSAGCATGEEAYSLAILAMRVQNLIPDVRITIHATDIDEVALNAAREGKYHKDRVNLDDSKIRKYFNGLGHDVKIKDELKNMVTFTKLDLAKDLYPSKLDLILCRNVMIYFEKTLQSQIYQDFYYNLMKDGYLVTGNTENLPQNVRHLYEMENMEKHIYRKA